MKTKKHTIEVREVWKDEAKPGYTIITIIRRVLRSEAIGNFNPVFCTYQGKRTLVSSDQGDLSDPFRREENYLEKLYIAI